MRILVTGAAGFLGSQVVAEAMRRGYDVRCLVRQTSDLTRLKNVPGNALAYGDMTDEASMERAGKDVDAVVHCAATTSEGAPDLELSTRVNVTGTAKLIEAVCDLETRPRWIQISSMSAHPESTSVYGKTKRLADEAVRQSNTDWTILRPSLIYGPGGKGIVDKTVSIMKKLPAIPVVGSGNEPVRPVYVEDVAKAALDCIERPRTIGKSYMIGGRDEITLNECMKRIGEAAGLKRPLVHVPLPIAMLMARTLTAVSKNPPLTVDNVLGVKQAQRVVQDDAERDFDYRPIGFEEGLRRTFA